MMIMVIISNLQCLILVKHMHGLSQSSQQGYEEILIAQLSSFGKTDFKRLRSMTRKVKQSEFRVQPETCHCIKPSPTVQHTCAHTHVWTTGLSEIYMGRLLSLFKKEGK